MSFIETLIFDMGAQLSLKGFVEQFLSVHSIAKLLLLYQNCTLIKFSQEM